MKEKSAGAVIFRENNERKYLLLHYEEGHWDFPKGNIEKGEGEKQTAIREIKEETGISKIRIVAGFKEKLHYFYKRENQLISKWVVFYLAETEEKRITLSFEHIGYKWISYEKALAQLTYKNAKEMLKKAEQSLTYRERH